MFTARSRSGNSKRCGVCASRSFGPISESVLMIVNTLSMTSRNSADDLKLIPWRKPTPLEEGRAPRNEVVVDLRLDRLADLLGQLEHEAAVLGGLGSVLRRRDRLAELDPPLRGQRDEAERAEGGERRRDREVGRAYYARDERRIGH